MKERRIVFLTILILALALILFLMIFNKTQNSSCPGPNCIKVQTTCCPCNMGGEEICVLKSEAKNYEINQSNCPSTLICAAVFNCKIDSCTLEK